MKGFILRQGRLLEPLGTPVGESCVLGQTLHQTQQQALARCHASCTTLELAAPATLPPAIHGPALLLDEAVFVTPGALRAFVDAAQGATVPVALGLAAGPLTDLCGILAGAAPPEQRLVRQGVRFLPAGHQLQDLRAMADYPLVRVDPGGTQTVMARRGQGRDGLLIPAPAHLVMQITHWVHLLLANLLGFSALAQEQLTWSALPRLLWAVLRSRSLEPRAVAARLNRMGRGCTIHPSAVVEGCQLGDRVRIGPLAVVQGCVLGDDVLVEEFSSALFSVLGARAQLRRHGICRFSTVFPEGEVGGAIQLSVLGQGAAIKHASYTLDQDLGEQPIRVLAGGRLQEAGLPFLGACLGHGALVGSGLWLGPGRMIPNGCIVVQAPDRLVLSVPADLTPGVPSFPVEGRLRQG